MSYLTDMAEAIDRFKIKDDDQIYGSRQGFRHNGIWNSVYKDRGHLLRERSELLLIKDGCLFIQRKDPWDLSYKLPGGSTDVDVTVVETAIKECQEEALITPCNVKHMGVYDIYFKDGIPVPKWLREADYPIKYTGYHTHICVGQYKEPYRRHIDEGDKDDFYKKAKWIPIKDCKKFLKDYHLYALMEYIKEMGLNIQI